MQRQHAAAHLREHVRRAVLAELQQAALRGEALAHNALVLAHLGVRQGRGAALGCGRLQVRGVIVYGLALQLFGLLVYPGGVLLGGGDDGGGEAFKFALFFLHWATPQILMPIASFMRRVM